MKTAKILAKIVVALAAVAGAVYVIATYGSQIVAWCKKLLASLPCPCCKAEVVVEVSDEEAAEEAAEETVEAAEEVAEVVVEEAPAEEPAAEAVVAEDADFEA